MDVVAAPPRFAALRKRWVLFLAFVAVGVLRRLLKGQGPRRSGASSHRDRGKGGGRSTGPPYLGGVVGGRQVVPRAAPGGAVGGRGVEVGGRPASGSHGRSGLVRSFQGRSPPGEPNCGPAAEAELGADWHFGGARRWQWLHDGKVPNGWIEFGVGGILITSFGCNGTWRRSVAKPSIERDEVIATFGNCLHTLELRPDRDGSPMFIVRHRQMTDGRQARPQKRDPTRGRLEPLGVQRDVL